MKSFKNASKNGDKSGCEFLIYVLFGCKVWFSSKIKILQGTWIMLKGLKVFI